MADVISYKIDVDVAGQLQAAVERSIEVEAYGKIEAEVPTGNPGETTLRTLPGMDTSSGNGEVINEIRFLMITSTVYTDELVLKEAGDGGSEISTLGEPVALIGQEAVKRLGIPDGKIKLENNSEQVATVHVIVGWDAVEDSDE